MNVTRNRMLIDMLRRWPEHITFDRDSYGSFNGCKQCTLTRALLQPEFCAIGLPANDSHSPHERLRGNEPYAAVRVKPFFGWSADQYAVVAFSWRDGDVFVGDYGTPELLALYLERELLHDADVVAGTVPVPTRVAELVE